MKDRPKWDSRHNEIGPGANHVPRLQQPVVPEIHKEEPDPDTDLICRSKIRYPSKEKALEAMGEIFWKHGYDHRLRAYCCESCGLWHLGHSRK